MYFIFNNLYNYYVIYFVFWKSNFVCSCYSILFVLVFSVNAGAWVGWTTPMP